MLVQLRDDLGAVEERAGSIADQVCGGLVARDEEQDYELGHLAVVERRALALVHQHADYVVLGLSPPLLNDAAQVAVESSHGPEKLADRYSVHAAGGAGNDVVAPLLELGASLGLDAEHFRDDRDGQRNRQIVDHVERFVVREPRHALRDDLLHA